MKNEICLLLTLARKTYHFTFYFDMLIHRLMANMEQKQ